MVVQHLDKGGDSRRFLTNGHIDAIDGLSRFVFRLLVDNGVDGDSRFSNLAVTDDEFALAAANWNHGVNRLETRL